MTVPRPGPLELDRACVVWDADVRFTPKGWQHWPFRSNGWQRIFSDERHRYLKDATGFLVLGRAWSSSYRRAMRRIRCR
jgi:hypothetical protein